MSRKKALKIETIKIRRIRKKTPPSPIAKKFIKNNYTENYHISMIKFLETLYDDVRDKYLQFIKRWVREYIMTYVLLPLSQLVIEIDELEINVYKSKYNLVSFKSGIEIYIKRKLSYDETIKYIDKERDLFSSISGVTKESTDNYHKELILYMDAMNTYISRKN